MTLGRSLITTMLLAATIVLLGSRMSEAQDEAPSPRMLLNLDLFTAPPSGDNSGNANESTLEQLRALRSMGYLSNDGPLPNDGDSGEPPNAHPHASFKNQGAQE